MSLALYAKAMERGGFGVWCVEEMVSSGKVALRQRVAAVDARGESRKCKCLLPSRHLLSFNLILDAWQNTSCHLSSYSMFVVDMSRWI